jgi:hypothetical protein
MTPNTMAQHRRRQTCFAESGQAKRHAQVADIAPRRGDALQAHGRQAASRDEPAHQHTEQEGGDDGDAEARDQARIENGTNRRARQARKEQGRKREIADEGGEAAGRLATQETSATGEIANQDEPEDRERDTEQDGHRNSFTVSLGN